MYFKSNKSFSSSSFSSMSSQPTLDSVNGGPLGSFLSVNSPDVCVKSVINDADKRVLSFEGRECSDKLISGDYLAINDILHCGSSRYFDGWNPGLDILVSLDVAD